MKHEVFDQNQFFEKFEEDLNSALSLVLIQSPFLALRRIGQLEYQLQKCMRKRVRVCIFVQSSDESKIAEAANKLTSLGIHVNFKRKVHEKLAVIDENTFWDGSLNILSHYNTSERMTRWISKSKVEKAIKKHHLVCPICCSQSLNLGAIILNRRSELSMTQSELSKRSKIAQSIISNLERGKTNTNLKTLTRIGDALDLELRYLPKFMLPSIDQRLFSLDDDQ